MHINNSFFQNRLTAIKHIFILPIFFRGSALAQKIVPAGEAGSFYSGIPDSKPTPVAKVFRLIIITTFVFLQQVSAQEMERLRLKYPMPMYVGTPKDLEVDKLEKTWEITKPPFLVPEGTVNLALNKLVGCSDGDPVLGEPDLVTDGEKDASDGFYIELFQGQQHITIDLEETCTIYAIAVWHYHKKARVYYDVVVQAADDLDFNINVNTLYNNDHDNSLGFGVGEDLHYIESYEGRLIDGRGVTGRYVRLYSNGNTDNLLNHYIEVEVYGKPLD